MAVVGAACGVVGFSHTVQDRFTWLDATFGADVAVLDATIPGNVRAIPSMTANCKQIVARVDGGAATPTWYVHHRETGETRRVGAERPSLMVAWPKPALRTTKRATDG